jgi:alpha-glucosidase
VGEDSLTFLREHPDERVLVHVARADHPAVRLPLAALGLTRPDELVPLLGTPVGSGPADEATVELPTAGPAASAYLLAAAG